MAAEPRSGGVERPTPDPGRTTPRVRLARLALESALAVEGVAGLHAGPGATRVTSDGGERLPGVVATALPDGTYALSLHLVAQLVPLHPLAEEVRSRVTRAAGTAGLGGALGPIDITIEDLAHRPSPEQAG
jgi:hypothetical protein